MKTRFCLLVSLVLVVSPCQRPGSQSSYSKDVQKTTDNATKQVTSQANLGSLVGQLTNNLSDKAFTGEFKKKKDSFTKSVSGYHRCCRISKSLQTLEGGLAPAAMDAGWGAVKGKWIKDAKSATTGKNSCRPHPDP